MSKKLRVYKINFSIWISPIITTFIWVGGLYLCFDLITSKGEIVFYFILIPLIILHLYNSIYSIKKLLKINQEKYTKLTVDKSKKIIILTGRDKLNYVLNFDDIKNYNIEEYTLMSCWTYSDPYELYKISIESEDNILYELSVSDISEFSLH